MKSELTLPTVVVWESPTSPYERGVCEKTANTGSRLDTCSLGSRAPPTGRALLQAVAFIRGSGRGVMEIIID